MNTELFLEIYNLNELFDYNEYKESISELNYYNIPYIEEKYNNPYTENIVIILFEM